MIELTKTRRLTVATIVFVLIILVGLITFRRPDHKYTITSQEMLTIVNAPDNFIQLNDINNSALVLVDLRQAYDFNKGTIGDAINIPVSDILDKEVINMLIGKKSQKRLSFFLIIYNLLQHPGCYGGKWAMITLSFYQGDFVNIYLQDQVMKAQPAII